MVDSIHPPDLILLNMDNIDDFPDNSSSAPLPDSPLSTPPDSPHRVGTDDDVKEEEKKEEEQGGTKGDAGWEEAPLDECVGDLESAPDDEKKVDVTDEPPSLSLVEEAKKRLSAQGLSMDTEVMALPSSKSQSPSKVEKKTENTSCDESNIFNPDGCIDEPPSLSRVEEAMKRTSMMVLKHNNKRDHGDHIKNATPASADPSGMIQMASSTATKIDEINVESSESNRLAALRRDIMSLKSSLSDMNMKLREEHSETRRTIALGENASNKIESNEGKIKVEHSQNSDETNTRSRSYNAEKFNDIPFATISGSAASTELSPPKTNTSIKDCETSFEQSAAVVSPDGEIVNEKLEDNPAFVASDNTSLHRNDCHVVPLDEVDEIMTSKNCILSVSKEREKMSEYEDPDLNITMETTASSLSQEKPSNTRFETITSYREMTPKKDLQGSDKSARWLQEELRRRVVVKRDINSAIEARGQYDIERDDTNGYNKFIAGDLPSISSPPDMQNSQSTMDEEVAAITANDERNRSTKNRSIDISSSYDEQEPPSLSKTDVNKNISRKLDYGDFEERPHDELMGTNNISEGGIGYQAFRPVFDYQDIQHEMKKFASETRAALREQSFTEVAMQPSSSAMPVESTTKTRNYESISIDFAAMEAGEAPKMLISMDSFDGIASGDIFLSLLSENTGRAETSTTATWADRVHGAIWRARRMRKSRMKSSDLPSQPLVRGGSQTVDSIQQAALVHLKHDEIDDSINLVEGIAFAYYSYFERSLDLREKNPSAETSKGIMDFKPYIGMALHNLGVLNLLKGDYDEALSYFSRAVENRKGNLGEDHPHYISSLVRLAVCRYALNDFAEAHAGLEEALACAKRRRSTTLEGRLQVAEILNNLGCLAYMSGQPTTASSYYRDSMDIQFGALSDSLYLGNATSGQSISLNISIARANIGFIKLVTKDLSVATTALENALMEQQILLEGMDDTLIATMDHLALSNLLVGSQEKAALMYNRILTLQQNEYGPNDRRCFVTVEKMNMVQGKGVHYEGAIEKLRKTFSIPPATSALNSAQDGQKNRSPRGEKKSHCLKNITKNKKKKGLKALTSKMKKNP